MAKHETSDAIEVAAAEWCARLDRGALDHQQEAAFAAWLDGDTRRVGAFARMQAMMLRCDAAQALGDHYDPDEFASAEPAPDIPASSRAITRRRILAICGSALAASIAGAIGLNWLGRGDRYTTGVGEMRRVTLADGSVVNLNTASAIEVHFSANARTVLLSDGEVLFEVAKDAARPFTVFAGGTQVRAIGTAFAVRRVEDTAVSIVVSEGVVEVARHGDERPPVRLAHNMRAETRPSRDVDQDGEITTQEIDEDSLERTLSWRDGRIAFSDTTLDQAAREFARYSTTSIIITDPAIAAHRVSGAFSASDPSGFADAVATSYGLRVERSLGAIHIVA